MLVADYMWWDTLAMDGYLRWARFLWRGTAGNSQRARGPFNELHAYGSVLRDDAREHRGKHA